MIVIKRFPTPVIIGACLAVILFSGFIVYRTFNSLLTNYGYGTKEEIMKRQAGGGGAGKGRGGPGGPPPAGGRPGAPPNGAPANGAPANGAPTNP